MKMIYRPQVLEIRIKASAIYVVLSYLFDFLSHFHQSTLTLMKLGKRLVTVLSHLMKYSCVWSESVLEEDHWYWCCSLDDIYIYSFHKQCRCCFLSNSSMVHVQERRWFGCQDAYVYKLLSLSLTLIKNNTRRRRHWCWLFFALITWNFFERALHLAWIST